MKDNNMISKKIMPPTFFYIYIMLAVALHFVVPIKQLIVGPYRLLGVIPILFGLWLNLWADQLFKKLKTTVKPFEKSTTFIDEGPFRFTRNPMYVGMTAALVGVAIILGSVLVFLIPILFAVHMHRAYIVHEETALAEIFGRGFTDYCGRVRRWL